MTLHSFDTALGEVIVEKLTKQDWYELNAIIDDYLKTNEAFNEREATLKGFVAWMDILTEIFKKKDSTDPLH